MMTTDRFPGLTTPAMLSQDHAADPTPIEQLRINAGAASDRDLVATCTRALSGDAESLVACERILRDAQ